MAKPVVRLAAVQWAFWVGVAGLVARAGQVQLVRGGEYAEVASAQRTNRVVLPAARGNIYDRNGTPVALTVENYHVGVAPNELTERERAEVLLAKHLGLSRRTVRRELTEPFAYFHGPFTHTQVQPLLDLSGVYPEQNLARFYPASSLARALLGRPPAPGRPAGGLERVLDTLLTGTPGSAVVLRDVHGTQYESPSRVDAFPVPGHDVFLTIDIELQDIVESALDDALREFNAASGDVVVLNPKTGEILAATSRTRDGRSTTSVFTSAFEPGSTAKLFTAAALLMSGTAELKDLVWTENGKWTTEHRTIEDDHPHGWLTFRQVIEQSSNIGMAKLSSRLDHDVQYEMLRAFGIGAPTGVEYSSESSGILRRPHRWSQLTPASLAIGYEFAVTPLQLAQAYAVLANDGVLVRPGLIREVRDRRGKVVYRRETETVRRVIPASVAIELRAALRDVVYAGGTGDSAALTTYEVAGKTGTARRAGAGGYIPNSYTATFCSLFPADDPQLVMVVKLDDPDETYAAMTAAPLTRFVLEQVLAGKTRAIDRGRLSRRSEPIPETHMQSADDHPSVVPVPIPEVFEAPQKREVPDVIGMPFREAAKLLHGEGLRMRVSGWGRVRTTTPKAGSMVSKGTVILVRGDKRTAQ